MYNGPNYTADGNNQPNAQKIFDQTIHNGALPEGSSTKKTLTQQFIKQKKKLTIM